MGGTVVDNVLRSCADDDVITKPNKKVDSPKINVNDVMLAMAMVGFAIWAMDRLDR